MSSCFFFLWCSLSRHSKRSAFCFCCDSVGIEPTLKISDFQNRVRNIAPSFSLRLGHLQGKTTLGCFLTPSGRFATLWEACQTEQIPVQNPEWLDALGIFSLCCIVICPQNPLALTVFLCYTVYEK